MGIVAVLLVGAVVGDYYYLGSLVNRQSVKHLQSSGASTENILLIGSTTRCGLKTQNLAYGLCSQGITGVNSDANQAQSVAAGLAAKGYHIAAVGDRVPTGPLTETVVRYGGVAPPANADWKNPGLEAAQSVMSQLEGPAIIGYNPALVTPGALVTVQTGSGLTLKPTVRTNVTATTKAVTSSVRTTSLASNFIELASSSTGSSTTTTIPDPSGIASNPNFGVPSATNPSLEPWDPRACNAAGTSPSTTP